ncbi:MAG: hypothetical protein FWG89_01570 [Treponema sp.]|nr:hypothetical protein [Treponema sp.]
MSYEQPAIQPMAVLQAGEYPLWFQLTANGPKLLESIIDAEFSAALMPWPLAPHIRFSLAWGKDVLMAVNRDGFLCFSPWTDRTGENDGIGMYHFSGKEFWPLYTVGAFIMYDDKPAALLYRDDRFLDSGVPLPSPRLWTFDFFSNVPQPLAMPSIDIFSPEDGWDVDSIRRGVDGNWFYRAVRKSGSTPGSRMFFRSDNLAVPGEQVYSGAFQGAAMPELPVNAPEPLRKMLDALFIEGDCQAVIVVSPEFQSARFFALNRESTAFSGFYSNISGSSGAFLVVTHPRGDAVFIENNSRYFSLPALPRGFAYTGITVVGNTIVASWEEQEGYSIGAAGFMVLALPHF